MIYSTVKWLKIEQDTLRFIIADSSPFNDFLVKLVRMASPALTECSRLM